MAADNTATTAEPDPRYQVREAGGIEVRVERDPELPPAPADATLLDISAEGAKLLVPSCLQINETIILTIGVPELERELSLPASVRWSQPSREGTWRLGCRFNRELPLDVLGELAALGYIDRRRDRRQDVDLDARARWELAEKGFPVRIVSFSAGGFRISSTESGRTGERLVLQLDDGEGGQVLVHGRALWQRMVDTQCLIGCALASRQDYELLRKAVQCASARRGGIRSLLHRFLLCLALLIAALAVPLALYLFWR